jgi:acyl carrier protein
MASLKSVGEIEVWLVKAFADCMGLDAKDIEPTNRFADYGGDSIALITLLGDLELLVGMKLAPEIVWQHPSFRQLATEVARLASPEAR